jgi:hypothetical protein
MDGKLHEKGPRRSLIYVMDDGTDDEMDDRINEWMESFISSTTTSFNI